MNESDKQIIRITEEDIREANQLSLHCPICANPVEKYVDDPALTPVVCRGCGTLYHKACWEQSGGQCAILGCDHKEYFVHGTPRQEILRIRYTDLPVNGRSPHTTTRRLKAEQKRQVERLRRHSFWQRLWRWLLNQIRIG
ncbi:MAG: hypothetical protein D6706_03340 [Chloroflexi bacterium]|nr:MAG: hypothetical protein D6706_03340 [Chloroflexota bacterium]